MIVRGERLKRAILLALADTELQKIMQRFINQNPFIRSYRKVMYPIVLPTERSDGW